jgi:ribosomal protein S18 acetylase RimI-like enzyme
MMIRQAHVWDAEMVQRISAEAYTAAYLPVIGEVPKPAIEDYRLRIEQGGVWVLEADGEARGVIVLEPRPDHLLVYSVAVNPPYQRRGHGRALLEFAERHACAIGMNAIRLYTNLRMQKNLALYRRHGFVETGRRPHPSRPGQVLVDMEKKVLSSR